TLVKVMWKVRKGNGDRRNVLDIQRWLSPPFPKVRAAKLPLPCCALDSEVPTNRHARELTVESHDDLWTVVPRQPRRDQNRGRSPRTCQRIITRGPAVLDALEPTLQRCACGFVLGPVDAVTRTIRNRGGEFASVVVVVLGVDQPIHTETR